MRSFLLLSFLFACSCVSALKFPVCQIGVTAESNPLWLKSAIVEWNFKHATATDPTRSRIEYNVCSSEARGLSLESVTHLKFDKVHKETDRVESTKSFPICYKADRRRCLDSLRTTGCLSGHIDITNEYPLHENRAASPDEYRVALFNSDESITAIRFCA